MKKGKIIYRALFALMLSLIPSMSKAYDFEVDSCYYTLISTSEKTVRFDGTSISGNLIIPEKIVFLNRELYVTEIKEHALNKNNAIISIVIKGKIKEIPKKCFEECTFQRVLLPSSLEEISAYAFYNCSQLEEIIIPDKVKSIGEKSFYGCTSMKKIILPRSEKCIIGHDAFTGTKPKGKLTIPYRIFFSERLDDLAYYESFGRYFFYNEKSKRTEYYDTCSKVDSLVIEDGLVVGDSIGIYYNEFSKGEYYEDNYIYNKPFEYVYIGRRPVSGPYNPRIGAKTMVFGDCIYTDIVQSNYPSLASVEKVVFGKNMKYISRCGGTKLETIYVRSKTPPTAEGFSSHTYIYGTVYVPRGTLKAYQEADVWKEFWNIEEYDVTDDPTAIETVKTSANDEIIGIYDINGIKHTSPVKGLNIYKYKDGRVIKRIMK